jgi:hypothetical protein
MYVGVGKQNLAGSKGNKSQDQAIGIKASVETSQVGILGIDVSKVITSKVAKPFASVIVRLIGIGQTAEGLTEGFDIRFTLTEGGTALQGFMNTDLIKDTLLETVIRSIMHNARV